MFNDLRQDKLDDARKRMLCDFLKDPVASEYFDKSELLVRYNLSKILCACMHLKNGEEIEDSVLELMDGNMFREDLLEHERYYKKVPMMPEESDELTPEELSSLRNNDNGGEMSCSHFIREHVSEITAACNEIYRSVFLGKLFMNSKGVIESISVDTFIDEFTAQFNKTIKDKIDTELIPKKDTPLFIRGNTTIITFYLLCVIRATLSSGQKKPVFEIGTRNNSDASHAMLYLRSNAALIDIADEGHEPGSVLDNFYDHLASLMLDEIGITVEKSVHELTMTFRYSAGSEAELSELLDYFGESSTESSVTGSHFFDELTLKLFDIMLSLPSSHK